VQRHGRVSYNDAVSKSSRYDRSKPVFAVVRVDLFQLRGGDVPDDLRAFVTVKELVETEEQAAAEVERLQRVNAGKDVAYFYEQGRVLLPGALGRYTAS
jgi:hypothetical protein